MLARPRAGLRAPCWHARVQARPKHAKMVCAIMMLQRACSIQKKLLQGCRAVLASELVACPGLSVHAPAWRTDVCTQLRSLRTRDVTRCGCGMIAASVACVKCAWSVCCADALSDSAAVASSCAAPCKGHADRCRRAQGIEDANHRRHSGTRLVHTRRTCPTRFTKVRQRGAVRARAQLHCSARCVSGAHRLTVMMSCIFELACTQISTYALAWLRRSSRGSCRWPCRA